MRGAFSTVLPPSVSSMHHLIEFAVSSDVSLRIQMFQISLVLHVYNYVTGYVMLMKEVTGMLFDSALNTCMNIVKFDAESKFNFLPTKNSHSFIAPFSG